MLRGPGFPVQLLVVIGAAVHHAQGLYSSSSPVKTLTAANFQQEVTKSDDLWLIEFFASWCGHCKQFAPEYEKAAKALKGIVKVGAVEDQSVMGQFGVQGFPTVKFFGENKNAPKDYNGQRTAAGLIDYATQQLNAIAKARLSGKGGKGGGKGSAGGKSEVVELTDSNFDKTVMADDKNTWFLEFYAPWCGHCKALAPAWEETAYNLKGKVKVAKVDATQERALASRFGIQGFPTLKLFPSGKKMESLVQDYEGPRTAESMTEYALKFFVANAKAEQLTTDEQFKDECKKGLCILAFLPHILDSKASGRNQYLDDLNAVVKSSTTMPVKFFWSQGGDQFEFEEQLRLAFGYPAVIAVNFDKEKYAVHRGGFNTEALRQFLTGLMSGRQPVDPLPKPLKTLDKVKPWDGKDAPPPDEEDITSEKDEL